MKRPILCAAVLALVGCHTMPHNQGDPTKVSTVVERIKADLGAYQTYDAYAAAAAALKNACGGAVGFYIESVKVSLTTETSDKKEAGGSAELPVGTGTFAFNAGGSNERKGTQSLTFSLYPRPVVVKGAQSEPAPIDPEQFPIASALQKLRNGLLEASAKEPCVSLVPLDANGNPTGNDDGGSYEFGFTIINNTSAGGTLKFVVFSLGATRTKEWSAGNTITATFKARPETGAALSPM